MTRKRLTKIVVAATCIIIPFLILLLHLPTSPRFVLPSTDSGIFTYAGRLVTEGKLPYRDFFDHKPPLIYYLNALAISLWGPSLWSIWWFDVIYLSITGIVLFLLLDRITGVLPAGLASGIFILTLVTPKFFFTGNLTETYGLLPQVLIIGATYYFFKSKNGRWMFMAGMFTALASLFKQTILALGISSFFVVVYLGFLSRHRRHSTKQALLFISGSLLPWGIVTAIWAAFRAFPQFWDAVVLYNLIYVRNGFSPDRLYWVFQTLFASLPLFPLITIAFAGFCAFFWANRVWLFHRIGRREQDGADVIERMAAPAREKIFMVVFLAMPFEILFISLSGHHIGHYFITLLPSLVFGCAYTFHKLTHEVRVSNPGQATSLVFVSLLLIVWFVPTIRDVHPQRQHLYFLRLLGDTSIVQNNLVSYINTHTQPDDPVLVWQVRADMNFITGRPAPSRYIYPLPLFFAKWGGASRFDEFMQDIEINRPTLIILAKGDTSVPDFELPDDQLCPNCIPEALAGMKEFKTFIISNYALVDQVDEWKIYRKVK